MDNAILIRLLKLHFEHQRKLDEIATKVNPGYFQVDLLGLVLDAGGIPSDNTIEQMGKYGYGDWIEQPETFSRDCYYDTFQRYVVQGTYEECLAYLQNVVATGSCQPADASLNLKSGQSTGYLRRTRGI